MKYLAYPRYKPSGVEWLGDVPESWQVKRLKHYIERLSSGVSVNAEVHAADIDETGVLKTSCVYGDVFRPEENKRVLDDELSRVSCPVTANSVIISRMNTPELVGSCGFVDKDYPNLYLPDRLWIARFTSHSSSVHPKYLWYLIISRVIKKMISSLATGTSGSMKNLAQEDFLNILVPMPHRSEQHIIIDFLDNQLAKIEALVSTKRELIEKLKEKRTALISRTVTRGLPPEAARAAGLDPNPKLKSSGVDWLGDIPEHWEVKRLKYVASINDEVLSETTDPDYELLYVDISSVDTQRGITSMEEMTFDNAPSRARRIVRDGDIIISTVRTYLQAIAPILKPKGNLIVSTGFAVIRPRTIEARFLAYALKEARFIETIMALSVGVGYPAINALDIGTIVVPVPPREEQLLIANFLDREMIKIDQMLTKIDIAIRNLQDYRSALITAAVTGKVDVRGVTA